MNLIEYVGESYGMNTEHEIVFPQTLPAAGQWSVDL